MVAAPVRVGYKGPLPGPRGTKEERFVAAIKSAKKAAKAARKSEKPVAAKSAAKTKVVKAAAPAKVAGKAATPSASRKTAAASVVATKAAKPAVTKAAKAVKTPAVKKAAKQAAVVKKVAKATPAAAPAKAVTKSPVAKKVAKTTAVAKKTVAAAKVATPVKKAATPTSVTKIASPRPTKAAPAPAAVKPAPVNAPVAKTIDKTAAIKSAVVKKAATVAAAKSVALPTPVARPVKAGSAGGAASTATAGAKAPAKQAAPAKSGTRPASEPKTQSSGIPVSVSKTTNKTPSQAAKPPVQRPSGKVAVAISSPVRQQKAAPQYKVVAYSTDEATGRPILPAGYKPSADEEYMSALQQEYFRQRLQTWRADLVEESKQTIENLREEVRDIGDEAERATRETENSLELRTRDRYRKLIGKIDSTLKRMDAGDYGFCVDTGEEIGLDRLEARLTAERTIDAQERWEHLQKQQGD